MPRVRVENVSKSYGAIKALKKANLEVEEREYLTIIGPSGCGKTTLIKSIGGIIEPTEGEIYIEDQRITNTPIEDRNAGYVFQEIALFPHLMAKENIGYGPLVKGEDKVTRRRHILDMLDLLGLSDQASFFPSELSGGSKQKTAIGRALASGSKLLLLDEPLGMLDLKVRTLLRYELRKLVKDLGLTAIHVTHDQEEAMSISDRIVIMKAGDIIEVGTPRELYTRPRKIFTAKFLGEANFFEGKVEEVKGDICNVDVLNRKFVVPSGEGAVLRAGEHCVLAIRPEYIQLKKGKRNETNSWHVRVVSENFVGNAVIYLLQTDNDVRIMAKYALTQTEPDIYVGDELTAILTRDHLLIYRYPEVGLDKELALE